MGTSTDVNDIRLKEALELLEQRQTSLTITDPELDTRFFNAVLLYLLATTTDHWWCSPQTLPLARESLWLFSLPDLPHILKYKEKLNSLLQCCPLCVQSYYLSRNDLRRRYLTHYTPEQVNRLFCILEQFDRLRLEPNLTASATLSIDQQCCTVTELICFPYYLSQQDKQFCTLFDSVTAAGRHPTLKYTAVQSASLLVFHHHQTVRLWAVKLCETFAIENPSSTDTNQEDIDGLVAVARLILSYFGQHSFGAEFELNFPKYYSNMDAIGMSYVIRATQNDTNIWKGLRLVLNLLPDTALETLVTSMDKPSSAPLFDVLIYQLECTQVEINIAGLLKTMTLLWKRLQDRFWDKDTLLQADTKTYYNLLRQICDHHQFRAWVKIAQEDVDAIQDADGTTDSRKKLIRRMQGMVDWIFPFWCSLRKIDGADYMTDRILETLLSYFQLSTWTLSFRVYAAIVAFQIIQHTITENTGIPIESLNRLAHVWIPFAMDNLGENDDIEVSSALLPTLQLARESAASVLTDILCHDSRSLRDAYITLARSSSTGDGVSQDISGQHGIMSSAYPKVWDFLQAQPPTDISSICPTLLSAYAPLVSIDNIQQQNTTEGKLVDRGYTLLFGRMQALREMVLVSLKIQSGVPWKTRKAEVHDPSMILPFVSIFAYSASAIDQTICYLTKKRKRKDRKSSSLPQSNLTDSPLQSLLDRQPQLTIAAVTHVLTDFMELSNVQAETYNVVTTLGHALESVTRLLMNDELEYLPELVKADENDNDQQIIMEYWNLLWQVISTVFIDSYQWSITHTPNGILDIVTLWVDIAGETIGCCHLFQNSICNDLLKMDSLASTVDGLSYWIYVTRRSLLVKLVPLLVKILRQLQLSDIKISLDAYDRLTSAVNGLDSTLLEPDEKNLISSALTAHEYVNVIVLEDSDDEYMELHTQPVSDSPTSSMTTLTSSAARHADPKTKMLQQSTTGNSVRKPSGTSNITSHIDTNNIAPNTVDETNVEPASMEIDVDTFFDDWNDSEPSAQQIETPLKSVLPSKLSSHTGEKRKIAHLFEPPYMATAAESEASGGSGNLQPLITKRQKNRSASDDSSDDDSDSDSGLSGLMNMANKRQQQQQQQLSEKMQQRKNESENLIALFGTHQARRPIKPTNSLDSTQQLIQQRSRARQAERDRKMKKDPNINQLFKTVLSWSLENVKSDTPPHISSLGALCHVQDTYQSGYKGYFEVFEPLLLLEIWSQFVRAKETLTSSNVMTGFTMTSRCHVDDFVDVTFNVPIAIKISLALDDLVCMANHFGPDFFSTRMIRGSALAASESLKGHQWHGKAFLGKVMSLSKGKTTGDIVIRCYFPQERITILNSLAPKSVWRCVKVTSLMMVQREYAALLGLQYYELANDLLHPHPSPMPVLSPEDVQNCTIKYDVNQTQATAIVGALNKPKGFTLIQGPPGTGKTKTILALLGQLLEEQKQQKTKKPGGAKILVCAPSNAAVDEIAKRLKVGILTTDGLIKPKVVRIGVLESVNASVKDLLLDRQVDKQINPSTSLSKDGDSGNNIMERDDNDGDRDTRINFISKRQKIQETIRTLRLEMQQVDRDACQKSNNKALASKLRDRRKDLGKQLEQQWTMLKEVTHQQQEYIKDLNTSRARARESILHNCDIVCTTLNGSGHNVLFEMNMVFDTVIVDEAAQAVEVSTLIPLKYDCKRCILVGDPNQLPPTVLSQLASKFDYEQSLFARMEKNAPDNVYLLSIQYRMHPLISAFPSNIFYQSKLLDGPRMAEKTAAPWHRHRLFSPFMFFDVIEGQEQQGRGTSWYNSSEADAALALVDKLATDFPNLKLACRIGVITPYKEQLSYLKLRFERYFGSEITDVIDFNTVDGFQGQEKDIIIFSCVRANSESYNAIGFLSDVRRMNVGLTRAKQSLFVLGNADTLLKSQIWGIFVEDAKERGLLRVCHRPFFQRQLIPGHCPKNVFDVKSTVVQK